MTLLLNEAYTTLMDDSLRGAYNEAHSHKAAMRAAGHTPSSESPFSQWVGPDRPQGLFVDENICIGTTSVCSPLIIYIFYRISISSICKHYDCLLIICLEVLFVYR